MPCRQRERSWFLPGGFPGGCRRPPRSSAGYGAPGVGLVEAMVAVAVFAVAATLAAPSLRGLLARERTAVAANGLLHALNLARSEALRTGAQVTVCRAAQPNAPAPACERTGNDWSRGWIVVAGDGGTTALPVRRQGVDPSSTSITASAPVGWRITFAGTGQPVGSFAGGSFRICPADHPELGRSVVVSRGARIRVVAEACA